MQKKTVVLSAILFTICGCSVNNTPNSLIAKAHIFERKMLSDGKLKIYYVYSLENKIITDSSIVENKALPQDSIVLSFSYRNPSEKAISSE